MTRLLLTHRVLSLTLGFILAGVLLCGHLWMQNRYDILATQKASFVREISTLRGEVVKMELENRELASLEQIQKAAVQMGLKYLNVPQKVKEVEVK